jgi:hypothetical protein
MSKRRISSAEKASKSTHHAYATAPLRRPDEIGIAGVSSVEFAIQAIVVFQAKVAEAMLTPRIQTRSDMQRNGLECA